MVLEEQAVMRRAVRALPEPLRAAQAAIALPEVQAMLKRLADFNLGVSMPHRHDLETGDFLLPDAATVAVEDGLEVSFRPRVELEDSLDMLVPTAWIWREGAPTVDSQCYSYCHSKDRDNDTQSEPGHDKKHREE